MIGIYILTLKSADLRIDVMCVVCALLEMYTSLTHITFEPYAMKVARTVLRGGKFVRIYLSQLGTLVLSAVNDECHRLGYKLRRTLSSRLPMNFKMLGL